MTVKELKQKTKCRIFIERIDADGAVQRTEWKGDMRDYQIRSLKITRVDFAGFVLCVELEEEGAR